MTQSFYRWHWIPTHRGHFGDLIGSERQLFASTPCDIIKIVTSDERIPYLEDLPAGCRIQVRYHPLSENLIGPEADQGRILRDEAHAKRVARTHHEAMERICQWAAGQGIDRSRLWFPGLNELQFVEGGGKEPYALQVVYWLELLRLNRGRCIHTVAGEFGSGWPPNTGPDTPPDFETFRPVYEALGPNDRWSAHPYWGGLGVSFDGPWLAYRMEQRPAWMRGKKWWATEVGSDFVPNREGAVSPTRGWLTYPGGLAERAQRFVAELAEWEKTVRAVDPDLEYAFIFTADGNQDDWGRWNLFVREFLDLYLPYVRSDHDFGAAQEPQPPASEPVPAPAPAEPLPENEPATEPAEQARKLRWWCEETLRRSEAGDHERVQQLLGSLVRLADRHCRTLEAAVPIPPATPTVTLFSQRDARWGGQRLGGGPATIAEAGCLVTAIASMLCDWGTPMDPGRLNGWLCDHSGFWEGDLLRWYSIAPLGARCVGLVKCVDDPAPVVDMRRALARNQAVIVELDARPGGAVDHHWARLLSITADGRDGQIMDPSQPPGQELTTIRAHYALPSWAVAQAVMYVAYYERVQV